MPFFPDHLMEDPDRTDATRSELLDRDRELPGLDFVHLLRADRRPIVDTGRRCSPPSCAG